MSQSPLHLLKGETAPKPSQTPNAATGSPPPAALVVGSLCGDAKVCLQLLAEEGFECVPIESVELAGTLLSTAAFDLVVCELEPQPSWKSLVEQAMKSPSAPSVLLVGDAAFSREAVSGMRAGGWFLLHKPLDPALFSRTVAWTMHARHASRELAPSELALLYRITAAANSEPALNRLFEQTLELLMGAVGASGASVMLTTGHGTARKLTLASAHGLKPLPGDQGVTFGESVCGWVAAHQRPLRLNGPLQRYPQFRHLPSNSDVGEAIVAPILVHGETLGVLNVRAGPQSTLSADALPLVVATADVVGAAIHRDRSDRQREHHDRLALLGQLSASVAHELNNPLSTLKAYVDELLREQERHAPQNEDTGPTLVLLREMQDAVSRMRALTASLSSASRKPTGAQREVELSMLLQRAEALVLPQFKHQFRLTLEIADTPPVRADAGRLLQVLLNLLVNASQALTKVDRPGQVWMRSRAEHSRVVVEVEDNGPGISTEVGLHLFEPFFTTKPEGEGTGLGLSISRQIVREHGGDLTFTSELGSGTCFSFWLPTQSTPMTHPRLLVVDDDPALVRAMTRSLSSHFDVIPANSAAEALAQVAALPPDLVVSDYLMPGQDGVALARALRERGFTAPVVLLTSATTGKDVSDAVQSGLIHRVLAKPWEPTTLPALLLQLAETARKKG